MSVARIDPTLPKATVVRPVTHCVAYGSNEDPIARTPIHPGEHLAEQLKALDMSAAELARRLAVPTNRVTAIIKGQRAVTGDTALRLGHFFGNSPQFWLNLQSLYELRVAGNRSGAEIESLPTLSAP